MAEKPIYYGGSDNRSPIYYGGASSMPYGGMPPRGVKPMYYGNNPAYGAYGAYGSYGAYGGTDNGYYSETGMMGKITFSRVIRVISQRWLSVFVFLLLGLIISFAVYKISPTIYQASSEFTIDMRRATSHNNALDQIMPDYGNTYAEIFNTRISDWRSEKIFAMIIKQYQNDRPVSTVQDDEIIEVLGETKIELLKNSRIIVITARSKSPALAADIANAYAKAIEAFTDEENKARCDKAVSQIHANAESKRREVEKLATQIRDFRTANKVDNLRSTRDTIQQSISKTTADILSLETQETQLIEWEKLLDKVQKDPESFGVLAAGIPRAQDIAQEFRAFQDASSEHSKLLFSYTDKHPLVVTKQKELTVAKQRFLDATQRALLSGRSSLQVLRNQLRNLKNKQLDLRNELSSCEQRIVLAESGLGMLEADFGVANRVLEGLILDENKARLDAQSNNEIVRVGKPATVPVDPVLPDPLIIFGCGLVLSLILGLMFVLILDNLEDTVVNLADIEARLSLKVLAVLPHVRRKTREQVAKFLLEDKFSHFSEAVAGLRNLLDSPRYESLSHCLLFISTQPGEGKTITSSSVAISNAMAGKKTLHVDFDMRRPQLLKVWGFELEKSKSFSHAMQEACRTGIKPDFNSLVNKSSQEGLDVIVSMPPEGVSPSSILGSKMVGEFFEWARYRYDCIIVDSPPFGVVGDVVSLAVAVDSVIIMCCPDRTHFRPIQYCAKSLIEAGANILGVVVNDIELSGAAAFSPSSHVHRYGSYSYDGIYGDPQNRVREEAEHHNEDLSDEE